MLLATTGSDERVPGWQATVKQGCSQVILMTYETALFHL